MTPQATLRTRLVALFLAAIVPLFGLSLVKAWLGAESAISRATDSLSSSASLVAANQQGVVESVRQTLRLIANTPRLLDGDIKDCQSHFKALKQQLSIYNNLGLFDLNGHMRCDGAGSATTVFVGDRDYYRAAFANDGIAVSRYQVSRATGKAVITFALRVVDGNGNLAAIAFASISLPEMSRQIANIAIPYAGRLAITDRDGTLLAANPPIPAVLGQHIPSPFLMDAVRSRSTRVQEGLDRDGLPRIYAFTPSGPLVESSFFIIVSADRDLVVAPAYRQLGLEFLVLMVLALFGGWLAWLMAGRFVVKPAAEILEATQQMQLGRLDVRIPLHAIKGGGELARIAADFNHMAESLEKQRFALETELANSEAIQQKLHDAQRLGRIGYWQIDVDTGEGWWSDEAYLVMGTGPQELEASPAALVKRVHPDDRSALEAAGNAAVAARLPLDIEFRVITSTGEERWIHLFGRSHEAKEGDSRRVHRRSGVVQEITARKRAELAAARNTELLKRTGEMAKIGGWEFLIDRQVFVCSPEIYRIFEDDPIDEAPLDLGLAMYLSEFVAARLHAAMQAAIDHGQSWDMVFPAVTSKGRALQVRSQGQAIQQDGKTVRLVGACQDVTELQQAQEHLRLLESSISHLNDMVLITEAEPLDEPGPRILFVNESFVRRTGYSREEVLGKSPRLLQGPNTDRAELARLNAALRRWQPYIGELINYTKSGEEFWMELDITPIANDKGWFTHWVAVERDITHRKLAEQALLASEQRYAALFESAPVPMWVYDKESLRFLTVNSAARESYGYSTEEFLSMTLFDIRSETEFDRLRRSVAETVLPQRGLWPHRRKDGSTFPVDAVSRPIEYNGRSARFVVALDMTVQIKAEKDAQEHLFTLQRAADAAQAITAHQTLQGMLHEFAEQARSVIGAHQSLVSLTAGEGWAQATHAVSLSDKYSAFRNMAEATDGSGIYALACLNNRPMRMTQSELEAHPGWRGFGEHADKHPPMQGWLAVPLTGKDGKNIGLLQLSDRYEGEFTQQDEYIAVELAQLASIAIENARLLEEVSQLNTGLEQKVAERTVALARQEALSRALAEEAPQVVWTADTKGRITFLNRAWFDLAGGSFEDWAGSRWFSAVHPEDLPQLKAKWVEAVDSGAAYVNTRRVRAKDGSYHTMSCRASPVMDEQGEVGFWVGIDTNITEIKAIETALRMSNQELEAFSYSVSHDLRSPLNTLDGFSRLLAKQISGSGNEKVQHYLSRIQAAAAQMGQLIEDLLSLAQVSRAQLNKGSVDLTALARQIVEDWRGRQPERRVVARIQDGLQADGDARLIRVVMENLLGNAWKFTSHQETAEISFGRQSGAADQAVFFVRDNGAGFDMAYADKLFVPFQRLHAVTDFSGNGIGLATVSRVIGRHGGRVWAESAPGQGATFFFTVPKVATGV